MKRKAPLAMTAEEFSRAGHQLVDRIADLFRCLPDGLVKPNESGATVRHALRADRGLPETGASAEAVLSEAAELLFRHSLFNAHPRFFGYITASPAPIGVLGDFLASAVNQNCGSWSLAPMATEIEAQTVRWIGEFIGFPGVSNGLDGAHGLLVSGGNMANFVCFLAARTAKADWDVRKRGLDGGNLHESRGQSARSGRMLIYGSAEMHTWIQKAADLFGFGSDAIRWIPVDEKQRMQTNELRRQIQHDRAVGDRPFLVVGTAGSVSTGAVDPLPEISAICRDFDLWFHVDGAYGALAAAVPDAPDDLRALGNADSVAVDPHKWLYAPLEAGCALVRRSEHLKNAFSYHPPYYQFKEEMLNFVDYGPQNSRGFKALKVWLALQSVGRRGYIESIAEDMRLARKLYDALQAHGDFEVLTQWLSITTFRYVPPGWRANMGQAAVAERLNRLNQELLTRVENSGEAFFSNAVVGGKFALRACIVNFHTSDQDVEAVPALVARLARELSS
jgi:aromatic-L-amino-acid decarboxylase